MPDPDQTDWAQVTRFFNRVIEEARRRSPDSDLMVEIYSPALDKTLSVRLPDLKVEDFMKNLSLFEAQVYPGGTSYR